MTPAEQTVIIQRVCGQTDWFKTVHFRQNGTPILICSREPVPFEEGLFGAALEKEGIPAFDYEVVPAQCKLIGMTEARYNELELLGNPVLTTEEVKLGWHWCGSEWDGLLIGPGMDEFKYCKCKPLKEVEYMPTGVAFDPLTGCLTISPESEVKRVEVPAGVQVQTPNNCLAACVNKATLYDAMAAEGTEYVKLLKLVD